MIVVNVDAYDAVMILVEALKACPDHDPVCMTDFVSNLENYQGAGGPLTFDKESWTFDKPFIMKIVKNGSFVKLE